MTLLCVVASCQPLIGEHLDSCTGGRCRGCEPKAAVDGLQVCAQCRLRTLGRLRKLPQIHADLLDPTKTRSGGSSPTSGPEDDAPATLAEVRSPGADGALWARHEIRALMVSWTKILLEDFRIGYPDDTAEALIAHVHRYAITLLADEQHAQQFAAEIDELYLLASRAAYPAPPPGQPLGTCPACGTTVRGENTLTAECRGCGAERSIDNWQQLFVGDLSAETSATAGDLLTWLSKRHNRTVTHVALRLWVSKGVKLRRPDGSMELVKLGRLGTDQSSRALYSVADAGRIGRGLYGDVRAGVSA